MDIKGKEIVILGAARSGLAAGELAKAKEARVFVSDSAVEKGKRKEKNILKGLGIPFEFGGHSNRVYSADIVVLSPGIPQTAAVVQGIRAKGIPVFSEIEFASRFCNSDIIAITGSNGKTTTTTVIGLMLKKEMPQAIVAGNIGSPLSAYVGNSDPNSWAAVEVSSFQLETIDEFHPRVAIILNLSPNHLDWYSTYEEYIAAKMRILKNLNPDDYIIYDGDDPEIFQHIADNPAHKIRFSVSTNRAEAYTKNEVVYLYNHELIHTRDIRLKGMHNYKNIMAAVLACDIAGIDKKSMTEVMSAFSGVEHRLEHVATFNDIHFINDSKATTIESLSVALQSFDTPILLIAGGKDKGSDYSKVANLLKKNACQVFLIGTARTKISESWKDIIPVKPVDSLEEAVYQAFSSAKSGENVLLSPACSSFDMFKDYEDRGRAFKKIVNNLISNNEN